MNVSLSHRARLQHVRANGCGHVPHGQFTYREACNYVAGFDDALQGGLLRGFWEWLSVRVHGDGNYGWTWLVRADFLSVDPDGPEAGVELTLEQDAALALRFFDLLDEFLGCAEAGQLGEIFSAYAEARIADGKRPFWWRAS